MEGWERWAFDRTTTSPRGIVVCGFVMPSSGNDGYEATEISGCAPSCMPFVPRRVLEVTHTLRRKESLRGMV